MKNKTLIITNIIILSCVAIGLLIFMFWGINTRHSFFDYKKEMLASETFTLNDIKNINVDLKNYDIEFREGNDNEIKVEIYGSEKSKDNVNIDLKSDKLNILQTGSTLCFGFCFADNEVVIYIPRDFKREMDINTVSGDVDILLNLISDNIKIRTTSGDITIQNLNNGDISSTSGDITLKEARNLELSTVSGDIDVDKVVRLNAKTTSGEVNALEILESLDIKTTSGDVTVRDFSINSDSKIESVSGEVTVWLNNEAIINAETKSGDKDIKSSNGEYTLNLRTTSGDITVK